MSQAGASNTSIIPLVVVETLTGNSGGAVSPSANNINTIGTGSITIVGNPGTSTLTTQLTGLTSHNVLVGAGTATITNVAPSVTSGIPLISQGAAADPLFGTAVVAGGGTSATSFNVNGIVISNTTATGALASLTLSNGQLVIGSTGVSPVASTLTAGSGISITNGAGSITVSATGTTTLNVTSVTHAASPYTVLAADDFLAVDTTGGVVTLLFPNAPATGRVYSIKDSKLDSATNNITVTSVGGTVTFDGSTSRIINTNGASLNIIFDGTNYEIF